VCVEWRISQVLILHLEKVKQHCNGKLTIAVGVSNYCCSLAKFQKKKKKKKKKEEKYNLTSFIMGHL
jgi:hypothetical protein